MKEKLLVLGKEELESLLKEKYPEAFHIEIYIDYDDEGVTGNDKIIAEVNIDNSKIINRRWNFEK
ncbi:hypothetical protein [Bacillus sp. AG4(2022)]|uniref:hypothetical protein n=1 Tax=Bacillus sp. AG4(2022) TaxID=2962594 RepID=UPI002882090C|nr:hypothetical protein [Bacillus sp. AG4(2022)]MDT0160328.1 hypothetical protein [Bacillus sp. AG4(2022)]